MKNKNLQKLAIFLGILAVASCRPSDESDTSRTLIHNGIGIEDSKYPAIVSVGGCTATFVSDNTLIYAAHCLGGNGGTVRVTRPFKAASIKSFRNPKYTAIGANDVAVAIFPDGTAKDWIPLYKGARDSGTKIHMVGFGCDSMGGGATGKKKEGWNTITSASTGVIISDSKLSSGLEKGEDVAVCPGDSGGPLLIDGKLAGVTSWHNNGARSGHPDLQNASNMAFIRSLIALGAKIPSLDGEDPGANPIGGPTQPTGSITVFLHPATTATTANEVSLNVAASLETARLLVCNEKADCSSAGTPALSAVSFQKVGNRTIFNFGAPLNLSATQQFTFIGLNAAGAVTSKRTVNLKSN